MELLSHDTLHRDLGRVRRRLLVERSGIPFHAAACVFAGGVGMMIPGHSHAGKSTLVTGLCTWGNAHLISDDTVWLKGASARGIGAPISIRTASPFWPAVRQRWHADDSDRLLFLPEDLGGPPIIESGEIGTIAFPALGSPSAGVNHISSAEAFCRLITAMLRPCTVEEYLDVAKVAATSSSAVLAFDSVDDSLRIAASFAEEGCRRDVEIRQLSPDVLSSADFFADVAGIQFDEDAVLWRASRGAVVLLTGWNVAGFNDSLRSELSSLGLARSKK